MDPHRPQDEDVADDILDDRVPECSKARLGDCLRTATRLRNVRRVLEEMKRYGAAVSNLQKETAALEKGLENLKDPELTDPGYNRPGKEDTKELKAVIQLIEEKGRRALLCLAAGNGHKAVVKLLLSTGINNPVPTDLWWERQTALWLAVQNNHEAVVKLFADADGVNPGVPDSGWDGQRALWLAAKNGDEVVVKLLLETSKVDLNAMNPKRSDRLTALSLAARGGHEAVVKLLLDTGKVHLDHSLNGRVALWRAASNGHAAVVKLLLDIGKVEPQARS
ncbi:hypothetical protein MFIFM68171_03516 [Madurella fahalii]|uniref:Uncharacterized protein n=1 Tax=Madurella fahalii TaxID=1157608 RepID=A0ABQ0G6D4_9PEZI